MKIALAQLDLHTNRVMAGLDPATHAVPHAPAPHP